jgi:hypothetical protein
MVTALIVFPPGLPNGIFSNQKLDKFWSVLQGNVLANFMVIWYISMSFGIFSAIWYILWPFGMLCQEKSGNPGFHQYTLEKTMTSANKD